jgi:triphosphatase
MKCCGQTFFPKAKYMTLTASPDYQVEITILVSREGVATAIDTPVLARITGARVLSPAFDPKFERSPRFSEKWEGSVAIAFDRGEWVVDDCRVPSEEVETEPKAGHALFGIARRLAADAFMRKPLGRKSEHRHRLVGQEGPIAHEARATRIPHDMVAIEGFCQVARSCLDQISANAELLRRSSNREALHELRVGLRRLRAAFTAFEHILPRESLNRWKHETKWLASELDSARDLDVFINYMWSSKATDAQDDDLSAVFGERLLLAQAAAYDLAVTAINSNHFASLLQGFTEWVESAPGTHDNHAPERSLRDGDASVMAVQTLRHLHRQLRKAGNHLATLSPERRHQARIKAKKLRYSAEFFS